MFRKLNNTFVFLLYLIFNFFAWNFFLPIKNFWRLTYNFEDNIWYFNKIKVFSDVIKDFSVERLVDFYSSYNMVAPLREYMWSLLSMYFTPILVGNIFIFMNTLLSAFFTYLLIKRLSKWDVWLSILWGTFFWFSSLLIYIQRFNLVWIFFLPLIVLYLLRTLKQGKLSNFLLLITFSTLLILSSTYYILYPFIILFVWLLSVNKSRILKFIKISFVTWLVSYVIWWSVYMLPYVISDNNSRINQVVSERALDFYGYDYWNLFVTNINNPFTNNDLYTTLKWIFYQWVEAKRFRYSSYVWITSLLILLYIVFMYFNKTVTLKEEKSTEININTFAILLMICGIMLYWWEYLVFLWNHYEWIKLPLYYLHQLPYWEIFRKWVYFFNLFAFWWALLIAKNFKNLSLSFAVLISIILFLENNFSFKRPYFEFIDMSDYNKYLNDSDKYYLSLPNSWFTTHYYNLYHNLNDFESKIYTYPSFFHKEDSNFHSKKHKEIDWNCILNNLIKDWTCEYSLNDFKYLLDIWLDRIILHKNYIHWFFFFSKEWSWNKFLNNLNYLSSIPEIQVIYEDKNIIVFNIRNRLTKTIAEYSN